MSILESNKIDIASIIEQDGKNVLVLVLVDHTDWEDEYTHLRRLQEKIYSYADYVADGQYKETFPNKKIDYAEIDIRFVYDIPNNCKKFLHSINQVIAEDGVAIKATVQCKEMPPKDEMYLKLRKLPIQTKIIIEWNDGTSALCEINSRYIAESINDEELYATDLLIKNILHIGSDCRISTGALIAITKQDPPQKIYTEKGKLIWKHK